MLVPCTAVVAGTVYKWVDQNGVTHYSDQPNPGAEKVTVDAPKASSTNTAAANAPRDVVLPTQTNGPTYSACEIASPTNDQVFMNVTSVSGSLRLQPQLYAGHRVSVALDGKRLEGVSDTSFTISPIFRGTHTLNLTVENSNGGVVCNSPPVTFHVRQPSAQAPRGANRPRF
jgi:Domain of unknown function (DUF4124)